MVAALHFSGNAEADALLAAEPLALLIGFAIDQQVTVQKAFAGPLVLKQRLGTLDAAEIAAMDAARVDEAFRESMGMARLAREQLFLREQGDELEMALFLDEATLRGFAQGGPGLRGGLGTIYVT